VARRKPDLMKTYHEQPFHQVQDHRPPGR